MPDLTPRSVNISRTDDEDWCQISHGERKIARYTLLRQGWSAPGTYEICLADLNTRASSVGVFCCSPSAALPSTRTVQRDQDFNARVRGSALSGIASQSAVPCDRD